METTSSPKFNPCIEVALANERINLLIEKRYREALARIDWHVQVLSFNRTTRETIKSYEEFGMAVSEVEIEIHNLVKTMHDILFTPPAIRRRRWYERKPRV